MIYRIHRRKAARKPNNSYPCQITRFSPVGEAVIQYFLTDTEYRNVLYDILCDSKWRGKVASITNIPPTLHRALVALDVSLTKLFPNLEDSNDNAAVKFLSHVVVTQRIDYHRKCPTMQQQTDTESDFDYAKNETSSSSDTESIRSSRIIIPATPSKKIKLTHLNSSSTRKVDSSDSDEDEDSDSSSSYSSQKGESKRKRDYSDSDRETNESFDEDQDDSSSTASVVSSNTINCDLLIDADGIVNISSFDASKEQQSQKIYHPYTLSAAVFSMCVYLYRRLLQSDKTTCEHWTPRKMYLYIKDYLADQVSLDNGSLPPFKLKELANDILTFVSFTNHSTDQSVPMFFMKQFVSYFKDIHNMLLKHQKQTASVISHSARLEQLKILTPSEYERLITKEFYDYHMPTPDREPAVFHVPNSNDVTYVLFDRKNVSPLELHTSLTILAQMFYPNHRAIVAPNTDPLWNIAFTEEETLMAIDTKFFHVIRNVYTPHLLQKSQTVSRHVPFPTYYTHLHNYFYGGNFGLITTMNFILRSFSAHSDGKAPQKLVGAANRMITSDTESLVSYYKLLHIIIDRFHSRDIIWMYLIEPYKDVEGLWFEEGRLKGIRDDTPTFYSALRSFILVYGQHYIFRKTLQMIIEHFTANEELIANHPLLWKLMINMIKSSGSEECLAIPVSGVLRASDYDHPHHTLFYYLCASKDIDDELAREIFMGISVCLMEGGKNSRKKMCESISAIRFPCTSARALKLNNLENNKFILMKEILEYKKTIPKAAPDSPEISGNAVDQAPPRRKPWRPRETPECAAFDFLLQTLEELSFFATKNVDRNTVVNLSHRRYRGSLKHRTDLPMYTNISPREVLYDKDNQPRLPIDINPTTEEPIFLGECIPIWSSAIIVSEGLEKVNACAGDLEKRPFIGARPDLLECILLQPIVSVDALPQSNIPLQLIDREPSFEDMQNGVSLPVDGRMFYREMTHKKHLSPHPPAQDSISKRVDKLANKFTYVLNDRKGWNGKRPSVGEIFSVLRT